MKNFTIYLKNITSAFRAKHSKKLKVISTFNGIGAASEALRQLGISVEMQTVCEIDSSANATYFHNFPEYEKHLVTDIRVLEKTVQKDLKLDLLVQTPPCQSFSQAGKREGLESDNGNLFLIAINLQKRVDANIVIYENVKGLISHDKKVGEYLSLINNDYMIGHTLHRIETLLLEDCRYNYYWKVINSADQGLPQNRERIFIVGIKKELDSGFTFPPNKDLDFTVTDCLEKDVDESYFYANKAKHKLIPTKQVRRKNRIHTLAKYAETMTYESTRRVYAPYVSPCIVTGNYSKYEINGTVRALTPTESKRIHGFSEEYQLVGSKTQQNKQLGNTVSPGVYVNLFSEIFKAVLFDKPVNNPDYKRAVRRGRPLKQTVITNNHINVVKKIVNAPDEGYLNLTQERYREYESHLEKGGTLSLTIEKYETLADKKNFNNAVKKIVSIKELKKLGFRDKKNSIYRVKITQSDKDVLEKVSVKQVLITRPGGKSKFRAKFDYVLEASGLKKKKVPVVLDAFFGGGGLTFHNIGKLKFDRYIVNDLEPLIYKTYLAVKKDYGKVIDVFEKHNEKYLSLVSPELKNAKKDTSVRIDSKLQELRNKDRRYRDYYRSIGNRLNNHNNMTIYEVAGCFIFFNSRTSGGLLEYNTDDSISVKSCNNQFNPMNKTPMIKQWAYLLNYYNIELLNKDVFEVLNTIPKDSLVFSDSPYIAVTEERDSKIINYDFDNSVKFQHRLKKELDTFKNVIYSNEHCKRLYDLGLTDNFEGYCVFPRKSSIAGKKSTAMEFLGYRSNHIKSISKPIFNIVKQSQNIKLVA